MKRSFIHLSFILILGLFLSCSNDDAGGGTTTDNFDRGALLANWTDNIIIPSYAAFQEETQSLEAATNAFTANPTEENLIALREAYAEAYLQFQTVAMFNIGKAEAVNFHMRLNTYPTSIAEIQQKIENNQYNLELPSAFDEQGFPAIDYLINGLGNSNEEILEYYTTNASAETYRAYLEDLAQKINALTAEVYNSWTGPYRDEFVANTSSSSTGSVDRLTNDYIMYYEKYLRSGKIGIPAGVFTGNPVPETVESFYSADLSKNLYLKALQSVQDFFNGVHFNSTEEGLGYDDYLDYLNTIKNGEDLTALINNQFETIEAQAENLNENLVWQVQNNNTAMLEAFDALQQNVVLLKVDMLQALSISVDYVDTDGD